MQYLFSSTESPTYRYADPNKSDDYKSHVYKRDKLHGINHLIKSSLLYHCAEFTYLESGNCILIAPNNDSDLIAATRPADPVAYRLWRVL